MPQASPIVLADAQATPVNHTFVPLGPDAKRVFRYEDQSSPSALGFRVISISLTRPPQINGNGRTASDRFIRVKLGIYLPTLETLSNNSAGYLPAPTLSYASRAVVEFILPERALLSDRKDALKFAAGLLADPQVVAAVESLQSIY